MPARRTTVRTAIRRPRRRRASSSKRNSRKRRTNTRRRIPRAIHTTDFFVNKYLVCTGQQSSAGGATLDCSINGSSPTVSGVIQQNANVNIYAFWFRIGTINNVAATALFQAWQEIRFLKIVFTMIPRYNTAYVTLQNSNAYLWTAYNKTGFIPTNLLQVEQMAGSKKFFSLTSNAKKMTRTIFPYVQMPMNDFLANSGIDKPIRAPWYNTFVGTTSNISNINAIAHTGIVVGVPSVAGGTSGMIWDIECEYWIAGRKRAGNV